MAIIIEIKEGMDGRWKWEPAEREFATAEGAIEEAKKIGAAAKAEGKWLVVRVSSVTLARPPRSTVNK